MAACVGALPGREVAMCVKYGHNFAQTLYIDVDGSGDRRFSCANGGGVKEAL